MKTLEERFWEKVNKRSDDECWEWIGAKTSSGYGVFGKPAWYAHRFSWKYEFGKIPNKMFVCHHCDNPSCVNPRHLFLGTHSDNMLDRNAKGRSNIPKREKHPMAKLKELDIIEIKSVYSDRLFSQYELANIYNVHVMTINHIVNGKSWK